MADERPEILEFKFELHPNEALQQIQKFEKDAAKRFKNIEKGIGKIDTGMGKFMHQIKGAKREWSPLLKDVTKKYQELEHQLKTNAAVFEGLTANAKTASKEELQGIKEKIKEVVKLGDMHKRAAQEMHDLKGQIESQFKIDVAWDIQDIADSAKAAGQELVAPLDALLSKDLPGAMQAGADLALDVFARGGKKFSNRFAEWGAKWGDEAQKKLKEAKMAKEAGAGGGAAGAAGVGLKALSGLSGGIGKMVGMFAKIAPLLSLASTAIVGLVKMFLDAESAAKDFNKEVLATAGTAQFLHRNMNSAVAGANDLSNVLDDIQRAAFSAENMNWGIDSGTHAELLQSLTTEGVSYARMRTDIEAVAEASGEAVDYVKGWGNVTQQSVAYSRALGVSLGELGQFQGEMMTDLAMSLSQVGTTFSMMTRQANEAGIASNKFFGIIRGVSADLSLYGTRMEDVVKQLTMLGKVMSPKNAQQFLAAAMGAVIGMCRSYRMMVGILSGGKGRRALKYATEEKERNLVKDIMGATGGAANQEEVAAAVSKSGDETKKLLEDLVATGKLDKEQLGALRESNTHLRNLQTMGQKGDYGRGLALGEAGAVTGQEALAATLMKFSNKKTMGEARGGIGFEQFAESLGQSMDDVTSLQIQSEAMEDQRKTLRGMLDTEEGRARLEKASFDLTGDMEQQMADAPWAQLMNTLTESEKVALKTEMAQKNYQEITADFQTSLLKKLEILVEFLMNQFYKVMLSIWETITAGFDFLTGGDLFGAKEKRDKKQEIAIAKTGNKDLMQAWDKGGGTMGAGRTAIVEKMVPQIEAAIKNAVAEKAQLEEQLGGKLSKEDREKKEARLAQISDLAKGEKYLGGDQSFKDQFYHKNEKDESGMTVSSNVEDKSAIDKVIGWDKLIKASGVSTTPIAGKGAVAGQAMAGVEDAPTEGGQAAQTSAIEDQTKEIKKVAQKSPTKDVPTFTKATSNATLTAMRQALFEYWLLDNSGMTPAAVVEQMKRTGMTGGQVLTTGGAGSTKNKTLNQSLFEAPDAPKALTDGHARGGFVSGVSGEGLALVAKGERIVPAGGGGGGSKVVLELRGDLKRLIRAQVIDGVAEFERNRSKR